jgi:hypothetical protein
VARVAIAKRKIRISDFIAYLSPRRSWLLTTVPTLTICVSNIEAYIVGPPKGSKEGMSAQQVEQAKVDQLMLRCGRR